MVSMLVFQGKWDDDVRSKCCFSDTRNRCCELMICEFDVFGEEITL